MNPGPTSAREPHRRAERRRLAHHDRCGARLAELHRIELLLRDASALVADGWIQNAWFGYRDVSGQARVATTYELGLMGDSEVTGACLVGGIVASGGGPSAAHSQLVGRALDLTWHTLREEAGRRVRWCPSPPVRTAHVRDLTRWNDTPGREAGQVATLLALASSAAVVEADHLRGERARL